MYSLFLWSMFSKSCEYALQAVLYLSLKDNNNRSVGLKEIAKAQKIPLHFLSKILQQLVKGKILDSTKGPNGGFSFKTSPKKLQLIKIVKVIDGSEIFDRCGIGLKNCSDKTPCPIHFEYKKIKETIIGLLKDKTVSELGEDVNLGKSIMNY